MARHFDMENPKYIGISSEDCTVYSVLYTWGKIRRILIYIVPVLLLEYIMLIVVSIADGFKLGQIIDYLMTFTSELFMLTSLLDENGRHLGTLWYLSAMVIVLPLLCFLLLRYRKVFAYIFSLIFAIYYIATDGASSLAWGTISLKRAFCFISFGISTYSLGKQLVVYCKTRKKRILFTIVEILAHLYVIGAVSFDLMENRLHCVIAFFIGITIMLSGCSYTICLNGEAFRYLGKLYVPVFVSQLFYR